MVVFLDVRTSMSALRIGTICLAGLMDTVEPIIVIGGVAIFPGSIVHSSLVGPSETRSGQLRFSC